MRHLPKLIAAAALAATACTAEEPTTPRRTTDTTATPTTEPEAHDDNTTQSGPTTSEPAHTDTDDDRRTELEPGGYDQFSESLNEHADTITIEDFTTISNTVCDTLDQVESPHAVLPLVVAELFLADSAISETTAHLLSDHAPQAVLAAGQSACPTSLANAGITTPEDFVSIERQPAVSPTDFATFTTNVEDLGGSINDTITAESLGTSAELVCSIVRSSQDVEDFQLIFEVFDPNEAVWVIATTRVFCAEDAAAIGLVDPNQILPAEQ